MQFYFTHRYKSYCNKISSHKKEKNVCLLSEDDLPGCADVRAGLGGALVGAGLQADDGLAGPQLLLTELALVFFRGPGAEEGAPPLWVLVGGAADREDRRGHQRDVLAVPQVVSLEQVHVGHAVFCAGLLEPTKKWS